MSKEIISLTPSNDEWLETQIDDTEFTSKGEVINDLISKTREIEYLRNRIIKAEKSGFTNSNPKEILEEARKLETLRQAQIDGEHSENASPLDMQVIDRKAKKTITGNLS